MTSKMGLWNNLKKPPPEALRPIKGGRLKGMSDIKPQWRYEAMTKEFGPCGVGWKFEIVRKWSEDGSDGQVFAFVDINLYIKNGEWSEPIPGHGGSMLIAKESGGLHSSDEAYKMALTDALSVAMKMIGVGAEVYMGNWDGSKYKETTKKAPAKKAPPKEKNISTPQWNEFKKAMMDKHGVNGEDLKLLVPWYAEKVGKPARSIEVIDGLADDFMTQFALFNKERIEITEEEIW